MLSDPEKTIPAQPAPTCYLCGAKGRPLYHGLEDRLFGAAGSWSLSRCPQPDCGLAWLDPMPDHAEIHKAYKDYYTHQERNASKAQGGWRSILKKFYHFAEKGYLAQHYGYPVADFQWRKVIGCMLLVHPRHRAVVQSKIMSLAAIPGGRLLDVGCGNGRKLAHLGSLGWQTEGVDLDPVAVQQAQAKGLRVHLGTLEAQRYPDDHFHAITMSHVIEHVHDPRKLLQECRRILKPGGQLVVTTPNLESLGHKLFKPAWMALDPPRHLFLYTSRSLGTLAAEVGLTARSLRTVSWNCSGIYLASAAIARRGLYRIGEAVSPVAWLKSEIFFWLEWSLMKFRANLGEELLLTAAK